MPTFTAMSNSIGNEHSLVDPPKPNSNDVREIAHELLNQLTVIDLYVFQLRYMARPLSAAPLDALERAVEKAVKSAKLLSQDINRLNGLHYEGARQLRSDPSDQPREPRRAVDGR
jgi:hypothetical protein